MVDRDLKERELSMALHHNRDSECKDKTNECQELVEGTKVYFLLCISERFGIYFVNPNNSEFINKR